MWHLSFYRRGGIGILWWYFTNNMFQYFCISNQIVHSEQSYGGKFKLNFHLAFFFFRLYGWKSNWIFCLNNFPHFLFYEYKERKKFIIIYYVKAHTHTQKHQKKEIFVSFPLFNGWGRAIPSYQKRIYYNSIQHT